ncbi:glycosyltransferase [Sphingopyxis sp. H050]|uniref:glycosyltransferase n=1 Tax=Sphingopyxis sp. H050 TaxID=1759072 RepID=UPI000B11CB74|nr:glycosyltransferase [Sphingopyxis sp. H050]
MTARILHIITGLDQGGAERSLVNLLESDLGRRFDHHVLSLGDPGYYGPFLEEQGIAVDTLGLAGPGSIARGVGRLRRVVRDFRPDIVQGWMYHGNLVAELAAFGRPAATAWNIRQSLYRIGTEKPGTRAVIRLLGRLSSRPRVILYNSYQSRTHHEAFGFASAPGRVIANGFDTARWRPDAARRAAFRAALGVGAEVPVLGFVGRFHPQKDVPTFLAAAGEAMMAQPDLHVAMVGEGLGGESEALAPWREKLPHARFHPLGRRGDIEAILPGFDFFCLSSSSEAFPNVIGEAMAAGLPCIATDVGDCARLMGGIGRIVPRGDSVQMAEAIGEMARMDLARRAEIGEAARARIIAVYSLDATVDAYTELYDSIMKRDN